MKTKQEIIKRTNMLEDDILINRFDKFTNFFKGGDLRNNDEMRGALLALYWVLEDENTEM